MLDPKSRIYGYTPAEVIVLDTETTGFRKDDEILQLSAVDGFGREVINVFFKPEYKKTWVEAEKINHISPKTVENAKTLSSVKAQLQNFLNNYKCIVGFNISFDIRMLNQSNLDTSHMSVVDVKTLYSNHYGVSKLVDATSRFGYVYNAHDSLEDVKATLFVLETLMKENMC